MPEIAFRDFNSLGGNHGWPLLTTPNQTWQFVDNLSWVHSKHNFRFGGEFRHGTTDNARDRYGKSRIRFNHNDTFAGSTSLEDFLAGFPDSGRIFVGDSHRDVSMNSFGWFVQDDWRVTPRFTLNAGVRYDLNTVIKEAHNQLGNWDPVVGLEQVGVNIHSPYEGDHNNFAPRIGFAWDPMGTGKTVIRGGFGMTYEIPHLAVFLGQNGVNNATTAGLNVIPTGANGVNFAGSIVAGASNPDGSLLNYTVAGPVFNTTTIDCDPTTGSPCDILAVNRHLRTPYVFNWNINVQRELWKNSSLQVGYVGTGGRKLYSIYDVNQVDPQSAAEIGCGNCEQAGRPFNNQFPFLEFINFLGNGYTSNYHSLQATMTQRAWRGLTFIAGYTWAHSIDDASLNRAQQPQDSFHPQFERSSSDLDQRHKFTFTTTYDLPGKKGFAQMMEGWQINTIITAQTGQPWNPTDFENDVSLTGEFSDRWNIYGNPSDFKLTTGSPTSLLPGAIIFDATGTNPLCTAHTSTSLGDLGCYIAGSSVLVPPDYGTFGNMGRNAFRALGIGNWDFSVVKRWKLTEKAAVQFRAEFFNLLNNPHFENPQQQFVSNDLGLGDTFGQILRTPDVAGANPVIGTGGPRNIQLGLKFSW
jgi:hypothetical protein